MMKELFTLGNLYVSDFLNEGESARGGSVEMKMMMDDGLFNMLPKSDDAWTKFLNPFLRLTRKEKNKIKTKTIKVKTNE